MATTMQGLAPNQFNPRGQYIQYGGDGRASVYVQGGILFDEKGHDLMYLYLTDPDRSRFKNILYWMNYMGYAMNSELRHEVVKLRREQELRARMEAEMAKLDAQQSADLAQLEKELNDAARAARFKNMGPIPEDPSEKVIPELELTDTERSVLGEYEESFGLPAPQEDADIFAQDMADLPEITPQVVQAVLPRKAARKK